MSTPKRTYELKEVSVRTLYTYGPFQVSCADWRYKAFTSESELGVIAEGDSLSDCIDDLESKIPELRKSHPELMGEI